jgi:hypothetical protein
MDAVVETGIPLCLVANKILGRMTISTKSITPLGAHAQCRQNVLFFMEACGELGVNKQHASLNVTDCLHRNVKPVAILM